jgi:hypothetical protein
MLTKQALYCLSYIFSPSCSSYFGDEVLQTIFPGWPWDLQVSASQVARIMGLSHQSPDLSLLKFLWLCAGIMNPYLKIPVARPLIFHPPTPTKEFQSSSHIPLQTFIHQGWPLWLVVVLFFFLLIIVLGVHCDIYKSFFLQYVIVEFTPSTILLYPPSPHSWNSLNRSHFSISCLCTYYFHHIHTLICYLLPLVPTSQTGPVLLYCSLGFFFSVLGFELRASCLLGRHSTFWATPTD